MLNSGLHFDWLEFKQQENLLLFFTAKQMNSNQTNCKPVELPPTDTILLTSTSSVVGHQ